ncbi:hypothetical protein GCM10009838_66820 [Catenulispora subtropica]|uniref:Uncharacterized protein n=1 Tax=Catenulispora subtropica TaxID=450798 RepID=A0ABP5E8H7_9ACTN
MEHSPSNCPLTWVLARHSHGFGMQTTLALALDLLAAAAAPDGTRRAFGVDAVTVSRNGRVEPGTGPGSPENAAVPEILDLLGRCLGAQTTAELPHLVTGLFRTVFAFAEPGSAQPCPTAALLYERITRAAERTLEAGWRGRAQERLAKDVEQWHRETSPSPARSTSRRTRLVTFRRPAGSAPRPTGASPLPRTSRPPTGASAAASVAERSHRRPATVWRSDHPIIQTAADRPAPALLVLVVCLVLVALVALVALIAPIAL